MKSSKRTNINLRKCMIGLGTSSSLFLMVLFVQAIKRGHGRMLYEVRCADCNVFITHSSVVPTNPTCAECSSSEPVKSITKTDYRKLEYKTNLREQRERWTLRHMIGHLNNMLDIALAIRDFEWAKEIHNEMQGFMAQKRKA